MIVFEVGTFLSSIAMIIGVMTIESCTINAVFDPEVLLSASIQKVLLATDIKHINTEINIVFLLRPLSCFLNRIVVTIKPKLEQMKRIKNGGKKESSILDQIYEEPQNKAFSSKNI